MKKRLAFLLAAVLTVCACSTGTPSGSKNKLTVAIGSQFTTLDPALNTEVVNNYALSHVYSTFFVKDESGTVTKDLCESYTVSDDWLTYTFKIRDAKWSDGVPLTAQHFEYAVLRTLSYSVDNNWAADNIIRFVEGAEAYRNQALAQGESFDCVTADHSGVGYKALDEKTVQMTLTKPCPYILGLLCGGAWRPVRPDFAEQHKPGWAMQAGYPAIGAYTLVEVQENKNAVLKKNPEFWNSAEVRMENIEYTVMPDSSAQALAFKSGAIDVALSILSETAIEYKGSKNLWVVPRASNYFLAINSGSTGPAWAKDVNVRRALALSINKKDVVEVLGGDDFYPVLNGYVPSGLPGKNGDFREEGDAMDVKSLAYNLDEAKRLLEEAGYTPSNPLKIVYKYSNGGIHKDLAEMLENQWKLAGISVTFEAVESGVYYDQLDQGGFEICRYGYVASDDAIQYLELWSTTMQVVPAVDDPVFDKMISDATLISDPGEYYDALHAAEAYLANDNVYIIPLFNYATPALIGTGLEGFRSLGGTVDFSRCVFK